MKLAVIFGSTRVERHGEVVFQWVRQQLEQYEDITIDAIDLRDVALPFYDEPKAIGALQGEFNHDIGKEWNARVSAADGFIMITPEYNHGPSAVLKNAIDYAWEGWNYKPVSFVSYSAGGIAGARATEQLRLIASGVKLLPLPTATHIPVLSEAFDSNGQPTHPETVDSLAALVKELTTIGQKLVR